MKSYEFDFVVQTGVYPPSEDTYLLIESIEIQPSDVFLEIGCGSGLVSMHAAKIARHVVATDTSLLALTNTMENLRRNNLVHRCDLVQTDTGECVTLHDYPTVVAFNPPYLPQDEDVSDLDYATVGGRTGIEAAVQLIRRISDIVRRGGSVFVLVSSLGDRDRMENVMRECGLHVELTGYRRLFFEELHVLRGIVL